MEARGIGHPVGDSSDAIFHEVGAEIEEKPEPLVREFEIGEDLFVMNLGKLLHGFEFEDDFVFDDDVGSKTLVELQPFVFDGDGYLPFQSQTPALQLTGKHHFVDRLQQAWAELAVDLDCGVDDFFGDSVFVHGMSLKRRMG